MECIDPLGQGGILGQPFNLFQIGVGVSFQVPDKLGERRQARIIILLPQRPELVAQLLATAAMVRPALR